MKRRLLLCRPKGGLNDLLCAIGHAWKYSMSTGRELIIDTETNSFIRDFYEYFQPLPPYAEYIATTETLRDMQIDSCQPHSMAHRIFNYESEYDYTQGKYVDTKTKEPIIFDSSINHIEDLLIYEQGWLPTSIDALTLPDSMYTISITKLRKKHSEEIIRRLSHIPKPYVAIHIRNSDYHTDYETFFFSLREMLDGQNILICSDDLGVFNIARATFTNSSIYRLSHFDLPSGTVLHAIEDNETLKSALVVDALADLAGLSFADKIFVGKVTQLGRPSGFSLLALALNSNQAVAHQFFSLPPREVARQAEQVR